MVDNFLDADGESKKIQTKQKLFEKPVKWLLFAPGGEYQMYYCKIVIIG